MTVGASRSFSLRRSESAVANVRRVMVAQLDQALAALRTMEEDPERRVHRVRTRMKKVRAILRMLRPVLPDLAREENRRCRDVARALAGARNADVAVRTFDELLEDAEPPTDVGPVRAALRSARIDDGAPVTSDRAAELERSLLDCRERIESMEPDRAGFGLLGPGLGRGHRACRKRLRTAIEAPSPEALHELRKRVKDHWYQVRLLERIDRPRLRGRRRALKELAGVLGDRNDLDLLRSRLAEGLLAAELEDRSRELGRRLFRRSTDDFLDSMRRRWRRWRRRP